METEPLSCSPQAARYDEMIQGAIPGKVCAKGKTRTWAKQAPGFKTRFIMASRVQLLQHHGTVAKMETDTVKE